MKDYSSWSKRKTELELRELVPEFSERDIWWCALGLNVGYEADGKNENFDRPVCVLRKYNKDTFLGLPLTSKLKKGLYYFPYTLHETEGCINLSQGRLFSAKRLGRRIGRMDEEQFLELRKRYRHLFD